MPGCVAANPSITSTAGLIDPLSVRYCIPTFPTGALILEFYRRKLNLFKGR
jgi:hypothetical protein